MEIIFVVLSFFIGFIFCMVLNRKSCDHEWKLVRNMHTTEVGSSSKIGEYKVYECKNCLKSKKVVLWGHC